MSITIKNGTNGNIASVNAKGRLLTNTIQISDNTAKAQDGDAYLTNSGDITLTTDSESAVFYVKNNEDRDMIITQVAIGIGFSTGGTPTEFAIANVLRNPTEGTIISDASSALTGNRNFSSNNTLTANIFKGAEGKTLTGGTILLPNKGIAPSLGILTTPLVLGKGSAIGITITPPAGNTSVVVVAALDIHLDGFNDLT